MSTEKLPVAVIGAGPVGLAAAAHLIERGETPLVLEAGLLERERRGVWIYYRVVPERLQVLRDALAAPTIGQPVA